MVLCTNGWNTRIFIIIITIIFSSLILTPCLFVSLPLYIILPAPYFMCTKRISVNTSFDAICAGRLCTIRILIYFFSLLPCIPKMIMKVKNKKYAHWGEGLEWCTWYLLLLFVYWTENVKQLKLVVFLLKGEGGEGIYKTIFFGQCDSWIRLSLVELNTFQLFEAITTGCCCSCIN